MTDAQSDEMSFAELRAKIGAMPSETYPVRSRGRPATEPAEARMRRERRKVFGEQFKAFRENLNITLSSASDAAGLSSARKLSQYETTCYPPGWVIRAIAPVYQVDERYLAALKLSHEDPDLYAALFGDTPIDDFMKTDED